MSDDSQSLRWTVRALAGPSRRQRRRRGHPPFGAEQEVAMEELTVALAWLQGRALVEALTAADTRVRYRRTANDEQLDALIADTDGLGPSA
jgi:hypothetical protein